MTINKAGYTESYYQRNKEECKKKCREYYWKHREEQLKKRKEYNEKLKVLFYEPLPKVVEKQISAPTPKLSPPDERLYVSVWQPKPEDFTVRFDK